MRRTDYVSSWPWPLTLKVTVIVGHIRLGTLSDYRVQISQYGPHGSDMPCDLMTLTFKLGGHGAYHSCGSTSFICTPSLKLWGLTVRKIWHILCICVSRPVTLTFDLLTLKLVRNVARHGVPSCQFWWRYDYSFFWPTLLRMITGPCNLWPWRSWRLWLTRVVLHVPSSSS